MTSPIHHADPSVGAAALRLPACSAALFKRVWRVLEKNRVPETCDDVRERLLHCLAGPMAASRAAKSEPGTHVFWSTLRTITLQHFARHNPQGNVSDQERVCAWLKPSCRWRSHEYATQLLEEVHNTPSPLLESWETTPSSHSPASSSSPSSALQQSGPSPRRSEPSSPASPSASGWALRWLDAIRDDASPSEIANAWRSFLRASRKQRLGITEWPQLLSRLAQNGPESRTTVLEELVGRARPQQLIDLWQLSIHQLKEPKHQQVLEQLAMAIAHHSSSQPVLQAIADWAPTSATALIQVLLQRGCMHHRWLELLSCQQAPLELRAQLLGRQEASALTDEALQPAVRTVLTDALALPADQWMNTLKTVRVHLARCTFPEELLNEGLQRIAEDPSVCAELVSWLQASNCEEALLLACCRLAALGSASSAIWKQALTSRPSGLESPLQRLLWNSLHGHTPQERGAWVADLFCQQTLTRRKVARWVDLAIEVLRSEEESVAAFVNGLSGALPACRAQLALELMRYPIAGESRKTQQRMLGCWLQLQAWAEGHRPTCLPEGWTDMLLPEEEWVAELITLHASLRRGERAPKVEFPLVGESAVEAACAEHVSKLTDDDRRAQELTFRITEVLDQLPSYCTQEAASDAAEEGLIQLLIPTGLTRIQDGQIAVAYGCAVDRFALHLLDRLSHYVAELERASGQVDSGEIDLYAWMQQSELLQTVNAENTKEIVGRLVLSQPRLNLIRRLFALCWEHPDLSLLWITDLAERCEKSSSQARELIVRKCAEEFCALDFELSAVPARPVIEELWKIWSLVPARHQGAAGIRFLHQLLICELRRAESLERRSLEWILRHLDDISLAHSQRFEIVIEQWSLLKHFFDTFAELLELMPDLGNTGLAIWRRLTRQNLAAGLLRAHSAPTALILRQFVDEAIGLLHDRGIRFTEIVPISLVCEGILHRTGSGSPVPPESMASEALDELLMQCLELPSTELESARDCWVLCLRRLWRTPATSRLAEEQMLMGTLMAVLMARVPHVFLDRMLAEFLAEEIANISDPALFLPLWRRIPLYLAGALRALRLMDLGESFLPHIATVLAPLPALVKTILSDPDLNLASVASEWRNQLSASEARVLSGYILREAAAERVEERARDLMRFAVNVMFRSLGQPLLGEILGWLRAEHPARALRDPSCPLSILLHDPLGEALLGGGAADASGPPLGSDSNAKDASGDRS